MNNQIFQIILFKVGEKFLKYILNFEIQILVNRDLNDERLVSDLYDFNEKQTETLEILNNYIQQCEFLSSQNLNSTIKQYLFNNGTLFNEMREDCGGEILKRESKNKLLDYLFLKGVEYYPSLLISDIPTSNSILSDNITFNNRFNISIDEGKIIYNLLKDDAFLSKLLVDVYDEPSFSNVQCAFENNFITHCFLIDFVGNFLLRSFQNCCYRTKYNLKDFLDEIETQYQNLEASANNENIKFSYFSGICGLRLDGIDEFKLSKNITIRNINETNNPCIKNTIAIGNTDTQTNVILGCTLEYETITKSIGKPASTTESRTIRYEKTFLNDFQTATILALQTIYPPFSFTFFNNSIPFNNILPRHTSNNTCMSILPKEQLILIKEWYEILNQIDLKFIDLTIHRIKSAIFNRSYPIDSILDAFIAWESMFSSEISTTKSVTKSINKMLKRGNYTISNTKLNNLYELRSSIAHGNPNEHKLIKSQNPQKLYYEQEEVKIQVIDIALITLKELIKDKELIKKTPTQRVEHLLNPIIEVCEKCGIKKYRIE